MIENDQFHGFGEEYFRAFLDSGGTAVTTDYVLDELITRLRYDAGHRKAAEFLGLLHEAVESGALVVRHIDETLWNEAEVIFLRYADAELSFTDCTSFAFLRDHPADEVFGFDAPFEMMGLVLQPKP